MQEGRSLWPNAVANRQSYPKMMSQPTKSSLNDPRREGQDVAPRVRGPWVGRVALFSLFHVNRQQPAEPERYGDLRLVP